MIKVNSTASLTKTYGLYGVHFFQNQCVTVMIRVNAFLINFTFENKIMVSPFFSRDLTNKSIAPDCYSDPLSQKRA